MPVSETPLSVPGKSGRLPTLLEGNLPHISSASCGCSKEAILSTAIVEEVARKLGGPSVLGRVVRSQADLALAVRDRLPPLR